MWLGLALVVWLWGLALYLAAYSFAGWYWRGQLYEVLGQDFYNAHIPGGGWEATVVPTIVFLATLVVVGAARRLIAGVAGWLSQRTHVPQRSGLVACNLALIAMIVPAVHAGVVGTRKGISSAIDRSRLEVAIQREAERRARDPFYTGADMSQPVAAFQASGGFTNERILLGADGTYRRSWSGCVAGVRYESRYERIQDELLLEPPSDDQAIGDSLPMRYREIRWGDRRYLLAESELLSFCNLVNSGQEPVTGRASPFLMCDGGSSITVSGLPELPDPWPAYLLVSPLEGRTVEAAAGDTIWVDLGSEHGLREGMTLFTSDAPIPPEYQKRYGGRTTQAESLTVLDVEARRCRVQPNGFVIPEGLIVTSRAPTDPKFH